MTQSGDVPPLAPVDVPPPLIVEKLDPIAENYFGQVMGFDPDYRLKARSLVLLNEMPPETDDPAPFVKSRLGINIETHDKHPTAIKRLLLAYNIGENILNDDLKYYVSKKKKIDEVELIEYYKTMDFNLIPFSFVEWVADRDLNYKVPSLLNYQEAGVSGRTMRSFVNQLEKAALIEPVERRFEGFHRNVSHYHISREFLAALKECARLIAEDDKRKLIERTLVCLNNKKRMV